MTIDPDSTLSSTALPVTRPDLMRQTRAGSTPLVPLNAGGTIDAGRIQRAGPSTRIDEPTTEEQETKATMKTWINAVCAQLNLPPDVNVDVILDAARVVAHNVERPAAPVTTFLLGLAVAGGTDVNEAAAKIQNLATTWPARQSGALEPSPEPSRESSPTDNRDTDVPAP